jgi:hypothetical protein
LEKEIIPISKLTESAADVPDAQADGTKPIQIDAPEMQAQQLAGKVSGHGTFIGK